MAWLTFRSPRVPGREAARGGAGAPNSGGDATGAGSCCYAVDSGLGYGSVKTSAHSDKFQGRGIEKLPMRLRPCAWSLGMNKSIGRRRES